MKQLAASKLKSNINNHELRISKAISQGQKRKVVFLNRPCNESTQCLKTWREWNDTISTLLFDALKEQFLQHEVNSRLFCFCFCFCWKDIKISRYQEKI